MKIGTIVLLMEKVDSNSDPEGIYSTAVAIPGEKIHPLISLAGPPSNVGAFRLPNGVKTLWPLCLVGMSSTGPLDDEKIEFLKERLVSLGDKEYEGTI